MKYNAYLLLAFFAVFFTTSVFSAAKDGVRPLVVSMSDDSYPFQYVDENGVANGLLVDLWRQWSRVNQQDIIFQPANWQQSLDSVQQSIADIHIGMAKTPARLNVFGFSQPISKVNAYLYINKALINLNTLAKLIPYKIGVVKGSAHIEVLLEKEPKLSFTYYDSRRQLLDAVINNEIFIFAGLEGYLRESNISQKVIMSFPFNRRIAISEFAFYPAVKKGKLSSLQSVMQGFSLVDQAETNRIEREWLGIQSSQHEVVIAMQTGIEPYADIGPSGLPHGLLVDIWKLWSDKTGLPIRFIAGDMQQAIANVKKGFADVQLAYPESESMKSGLNRAHLIYQVSSRLFSFKAPFKTVEELKGKVFAVAPTSPYLAELIEALPDSDFYYVADVQQMIAATESGRVDGFIAAAAWTQHYLLLKGRWQDFHQFKPLHFKTDLYVLNRGSDIDFSERIAAGFNAMTSAELAAIETKWILNPEDRIYSATKDLILLNAKQRAMIKGMGDIKVGFVSNWAPMEYISDNGDYAGINSEIFKIISQELGLKLKYVAFSDWQALLDALLRGEIDMAGSIAPTEQRQQQLAFSRPYWPAPWGLVTSLDSVNNFSLTELKGLRLAVVEGYHIISDLMRDYPTLKLVLVPDSPAGLNAVDEGRADVFIDKVMNLSAGLNKGQFSELKMSILIDFSEQRSHIGINKSKQLLVPYIDSVIANIDRSQQQKIHQKWVSQTIEFGREDFENRLRLGIIVFCALAVLVIMALLANRRLRKEVALRITAENKMAQFAKHDSLTKLPNRSMIEERLEQAILTHGREMSQFAVIFVDLDGFKAINDEYGHHVGDDYLIAVSEALIGAVRRSDTIGRLGGDEFIIILNQVDSISAVDEVAELLLQRLSSPFVIDELSLSASASMGIALYPADGDSVDTLLKTADRHMYRAKNAGGKSSRNSLQQ
ncbi:transporter substrate-binding domain-containing protein [Shewanella abyssi]|uniref:transporter substrate-binding domain-containing protein n=1 Tax=Shewanella abyssi TaxID=311789 RepID=UPI00200F1612|nr:transporter substrate-binding domain-containing protein [Shewanella abyssi]MCL1048988.1 transporter substrate-binding domain-containing protein [Shewanella abyssi]